MLENYADQNAEFSSETQAENQDFSQGKQPVWKFFPRAKPGEVSEPWGPKGQHTLKSHKDGILSEWRDSVQAIYEVGVACSMAQDDLTTAQLKTLRAELDISASTFSKLVQIGRDGRFFFVSEHVPAEYSTLYLLTRLTDDQFEEGLERRIIRRDMKRKELEDWLGGDKLSDNPEQIPEFRDFAQVSIRADFKAERGAAILARLRTVAEEFPEIEIKTTRANWHARSKGPTALPLAIAA